MQRTCQGSILPPARDVPSAQQEGQAACSRNSDRSIRVPQQHSACLVAGRGAIRTSAGRRTAGKAVIPAAAASAAQQTACRCFSIQSIDSSIACSSCSRRPSHTGAPGRAAGSGGRPQLSPLAVTAPSGGCCGSSDTILSSLWGQRGSLDHGKLAMRLQQEGMATGRRSGPGADSRTRSRSVHNCLVLRESPSVLGLIQPGGAQAPPRRRRRHCRAWHVAVW